MYAFLIVLHVVACLVLVFVVLLQAGRGGGFSDMMGGGQPQNLFGTQTNVFLTRATEFCAVAFIVTSLSLGILSTQRGKSLMEKEMLARAAAAKTALPAASSKAEQKTGNLPEQAPLSEPVPVSGAVPGPAKSAEANAH